MKILVDARMVGNELHGIARYVCDFVQGMREIDPDQKFPYQLVFLVQDRLISGHRFSPYETLECKIPFLSPAELVKLPGFIREFKPQVFHSTSHASLLTCPVPWIQTIHDLNHLKFGGIHHRLYYQAIMKPFAARAKALCTISEFSRSEIARWLKRDPSTIEVVPNPIDSKDAEPEHEAEFLKLAREVGVKPGKFLFTVLNPKEHKNGQFLAEVYRVYRSLHLSAPGSAEPLPLVVRGMRGFDTEGILELPELETGPLKWWMKSAAGFYSPSLYEGFGRPPVEAFCQGTPVIASLIEPHEESLGEFQGAGVDLVETTDFYAWVESMKKIEIGAYPQPETASRNIIAQRYHPKAIANHMDRIYRRVLGFSL